MRIWRTFINNAKIVTAQNRYLLCARGVGGKERQILWGVLDSKQCPREAFSVAIAFSSRFFLWALILLTPFPLDVLFHQRSLLNA